MKNKPQVSCHFAQEFTVHLFPFTDCLELLNIFRPDQKSGPLLIFCHVDFQYGHGWVTHPDISNFDRSTGFFDQLLQYIGRATGPLVMDNINQGLVSHLVAGTDDAIHLLLHLSVTPLNRIEIKV